MNKPINRRDFVGSALTTAVAAALMKPRFAFAKDFFSGIDAIGQAALVREKKVTSL